METVRDRPEARRSRLAVEDLAQIEPIGEASISPNGETIACTVAKLDLELDRERVEWRLIPVGGLPFATGTRGRAPRWSPDGGSIAFVEEDAGEVALMLCDGQGKASRRLTTFTGSAGAPAWSPAGGKIAIATRIGPAVGGRIAIVDSASGSVQVVPGGDEDDDIAPAWSPDGADLVFARGVWEPGTEGPSSSLYAVRGEGGADPRRIETGLAFATCPSWSPDGARLACLGTLEVRLGLEDPALQPWTLPSSGGRARLAATGVTGVIARPPEGPIWSPDGERLYFREARAGDIRLVEARLGDPGEPRPLTGGCQLANLSASGGARRLAFAASTAVDPGSVFVHEPAAGRPPRLVHRNRSLRKPAPALVHRRFASPHGGSLDGWIQGLGSGSSPQPLAVCMHGGPHSFVGTGFQLGHFHRCVLASRGWLVLTLNPSGSGSYGEEFADSIRGRWGERDLPEYLSAVDALADSGLADPGRLAVVGYSYGGYLAAWAIAHTDRFGAAVVGAPISDLESFQQTSDIGAWYTPWEMAGTVAENRERFERLSPVSHAERVATPTLILHGEADRRCPIGQAEELRRRIAAAGRAPVEIVRYPGADHLFYSRGRPGQRLDYNRRVVDWLERKVPVASR